MASVIAFLLFVVELLRQFGSEIELLFGGLSASG